MKNLRQSITCPDLMVRLCPVIFSIPFSSSNLCSVPLLSAIPHGMTDSFSIHSSMFQYESFLVIGFINGLDRSLSTLRLIVFDFAK